MKVIMIGTNLRMLVRDLAAPLGIALILAVSPAFAQTDPLPSWNDGSTKQAIVSFVEKVTNKEGKNYVPPEDRIATFDNDGTLWVEQPMYTQLAFVLDRAKALAPEHPEWRDQQPFKAVLEGDMKTLAASGEAALVKGVSLTLMGVWVLGATAYHVLVVGAPRAEVMGVVGFLALAANLASVLALMRYKEGDANVRSVWLCSRNDAIGNVAVMLAALGVWLTGTRWPDLVVAALMAGIFVTSSMQILRKAVVELRTVDATT
jgi:hypothetical protein